MSGGRLTAAECDTAMRQFATVVPHWKLVPTQTPYQLLRQPLPHHPEYYLVRDPLVRTLRKDNEKNEPKHQQQDQHLDLEEELLDDDDTSIWQDGDTVTAGADATTTCMVLCWNLSIVYNPIWRVPVLHFAVTDRATGAPISPLPLGSYDEHPVTGLPCGFLHPCHTAERLQHWADDSSSSTRAVLLLWSWWVWVAGEIELEVVDPQEYQRVRRKLMGTE